MQEYLNIVRDCWWVLPSGAQYVTDENGSFSSHEHALCNSFNANDSEYVQFHGSGAVPYYGRLLSTNIDPTHIYLSARAEAATSGSIMLYVNDYQIDSIGHVESKATQTKLIELNAGEKQRILRGRTSKNYDYFGVEFETPLASGYQEKKLYNLEVYYSGDSTWDNYQTGLPNVETVTMHPTSTYFPAGVSWSGNYDDINDSVSPDNNYMELQHPGGTQPLWDTNVEMPSGYLSLFFTASGIDPGTQVTRAQLNLRMSLPSSGDYENAVDTFEVNGYNSYYRDKGYGQDLSYLQLDQGELNSYYYTYGKGDIVGNTSFDTHTVELNFLDPNLPSGDIDSTRHRNIDSLAKTEFQIVGLPSGTRLSLAELNIEYIPNNMLGLYIVGDSYRCATSSTIDVNTSDSYLLGHGGWHHRGWRNGVPLEEEIFDNFYTFSETRLDPLYTNAYLNRRNTRVWPEETKAPGYNLSNSVNTVHGIYVTRAPLKNEGEIEDFPFTQNPSFRNELESPPNDADRYEYYRNPLLLEGTNDYGEYTNYPDPSYYRHMFFQGDTLQSIDVNRPWEVELSNNIRQVYFPNIGLGTDFTLYFSVYRTYFERSYGVIFERGGLYWQYMSGSSYIRDGHYEIQLFSQPGYIEAYVRGANGLDYTTRVNIRKNSVEPILIWFNCNYNASTNQSTFNLYVHDDVDNYFGQDWKYSSVTFPGYRYQQASSKTSLGTLSRYNGYEHLTQNKYLNHVSFCEFGYSSTYLELDPNTSSVSDSTGYDQSSTQSEQFLATRLCNGLYLNPNPSGVQWKVPYGLSEAAEWSTEYSIDDWTNNDIQYALYNPVTRGGTNEWIHPSAIYIDIEVTHHTDHPSGVNIWADIEFDSGSSENWKVGHVEFNNIASGDTTHLIAGLSKHYNMEDGPIRYSDLENINLKLTTKYDDISDQIDPATSSYYNTYGDVIINSVNVVFDSFCVAATGLGDLDLYVSGGSISDTGDIDLFVQGIISDNDNLDLYVYGTAIASSGDITLYTKAEQGSVPPEGDVSTTRVNLFVEGLSPDYGSGNIPLYMWSTPSGVGGVIAKTTLYTNSQYDKGYTLPLFLDGGIGELTGSINLYIGKRWQNYNDSVDFYIAGPSGDNNNLNLYIQGLGESDGYYPDNASMNLFMARDSEAVAHRMPLYLSQKGVTNTLDLILSGVGIPSSSIPLYVYGSGAPPNNNLDLYTHGF